MKIYNSITKQKETFIPLINGKVSMYVCGPTVYSYAHIGNLRPAIFFDIVNRYLTYLDYEVNHISNFTDVDDKIINAAIENNTTEHSISQKYIEAYLRDLKMLNCKQLNDYPKVTNCMADIIDFIQKLVDLKYAYVDNGSVFFRVSTINEYGKISHQNIKELINNVRKETGDDKENNLDFALWKKTDVGITWDSPWGQGRPGWHTECVVMIDNHFKNKIDIHGGGVELKFPHHENEVAQSLAVNKHNIANYWMHNGSLDIEGSKMSKSLGNIILAKDLLANYHPNAIRLALINGHYRSPLNYTQNLIMEMTKINERINRFLRKSYLLLKAPLLVKVPTYELDFNDDFNIPNVLATLNNDLKLGNTLLRSNDSIKLAEVYNRIHTITQILGLDYDLNISNELIDKYHEWKSLRDANKFDEADIIRLELEKHQIV